MTQKEYILQELIGLKSTLATVDPQNVYTVPAGYFDGLAAQVLNKIKAMEAGNAAEELSYLSPALSTISRQLPFAVPTGYFEELAEQVVQRVREKSDYQTAREELETLSPLLSGLTKQMPYSVPQGYFEGLDNKINKPAAKVISITQHGWFRYAAAAVITGAIVLIGFLFPGSEKEPGSKALAGLTRDIKKMDEPQKERLMDLIDAGLNGNETAQLNPDIKSNDVKDLLIGISDKELKEFQEQTEDIEDVLMTN